MAIVLVAYPNMADEHYQWIDSIRIKHHELEYTPVDPHFTLVFPIANLINQQRVIQHIDHLMQQTTPIPFTIQCAMLMPEEKANYIFLVPDEGFSKLLKLHDALYTGVLSPHLRLDIPYIPHITIGYSPDAQLAKQISAGINRQEIEISGMVDILTLMDNKHGKWNRIQDFALLA